MRQLLLLSWFYIAATTVCAAAVSAQGNDLDAPTGGRSVLMGNTGVALGHDGASPFNNPATIVRIKDQSLTFAVHFYSLQLTHFDNWHQPGDLDNENYGNRNIGGTGLMDSAFESLPSTLCLFVTVAQLASTLSLGDKITRDAKEEDDRRPSGRKLAICFATVESEDVDVAAIAFRGDTAAGPTTQLQSLQRRWGRTYIGPTYAISLNDHFAFGASLHLVYTHNSFGIRSESLSTRSDGTALASSLGTSGRGKSFALTGLMGMTYRIDNWTVGASLRLPSLHIWGSYDATFSQSNTGDPNTAVLADGTGSMVTSPPTRFALGLGLNTEHWVFEVNGAVDIPVQNALSSDLSVLTSSLADMNSAPMATRERYHLPHYVAINPSVGFEYFANQGLSLMAGASTNFTTLGKLTPQPSVGNMIQGRMSHVTASFGAGTYWNQGELLFGAQLDFGWGEQLAINPYSVPNHWAVVNSQSYAVLFVIAGSTNFRAIVRIVHTIVNGGADHDHPEDAAEKPSSNKNKSH